MDVRQYTLAPERHLLRRLRDAIARQFAAWQIDQRAAAKMLLVIDEVVGNAIDHGGGYRVPGHRLAVWVAVSGHDLRIQFVDPDVPEPIARELQLRLAGATKPPPLEAERGRGLFLIGSALDDVVLEWQRGEGLTVTGIFRGVVA